MASVMVPWRWRASKTDTVRTAHDRLDSARERLVGSVLTRSTASTLFLSVDVSNVTVRFLAIFDEDRTVEVLTVIIVRVR
jgi:hypothetical protein